MNTNVNMKSLVCFCLQYKEEVTDWHKNVEAMSGMEERKSFLMLVNKSTVNIEITEAIENCFNSNLTFS